MGCSHFYVIWLLLLQGGGVFVNSGTVTFNSCDIYSNTAGHVRALLTRHHTPLSYRPDGVVAFTISSFLCRGAESLSTVAQ